MFWSFILNLLLLLSLARPIGPAAVQLNGSLISLNPTAPALKIAAEKGALLVASDHFFLFTQRADEVQPIASISKLMTAMVFLDNNPGWDKVYEVSAADNIPGGIVHLFLGDRLTVKDIFYTSLVASDNGATVALVHATGLSEAEFVKKMNDKAKELGLANTHFLEPTGLSDGNVSTAREVALMAQAAFKRPEIRQATTMAEYDFSTLDGRAKKIESTDYLLADPAHDSVKVLAGKTGYTDPAGYCFVGLLQGAGGPPVIAVVLNSASKNERFLESEQLVNWAWNSYNWKENHYLDGSAAGQNGGANLNN